MCTENHHHWHHDYVRLAWDSGFCFDPHRAKSNFDWSSIGLVDVDRVSRDRDIAAVEKHITTILHYALDEDQTKILDPTFVKVFRLSQLSVQYLQFCKRYLDNTVVLLKKQLSKSNEENARLGERCDELETEIADLKKKVKSSVQNQPPLVLAAADGNIKCGECAKMFLTEEFLQAHVKRRHASNPLQKETDKLQLEIKELKERLNSAVQVEHLNQNVPSGGDAPKDNDGRVDLLQDKFERLKEHVEKELNVLRDQKQYQEKYDRWFELVFQRLENSQRELLEKRENAMGDAGGKTCCTKEGCTQTVSEVTGEVHQETVEKPEEPDLTLVRKMQEDIRTNTESHLDLIQDLLQQKLTGGLEQIQTQMNTFWEKINELQVQQPNQPPPHRDESPPVSSPKSENAGTTPRQVISDKPKPAPRVTKPTDYAIPDGQVLQTYYVTAAAHKKGRPPSEGAANPVPAHVESDVSLKRSRAKPKPHGKDAVKRPKVLSKRTSPRRLEKESSITSSDSSDPEPEHQEELRAQVKPSNTSTLAQRSITSLKNLLNDRDVLEGLKGELEEMVDLRLKEIGVSPQWSGLPQRSYAQALRTVTHRAQLFAKKNPEYLTVREDILDKLDSELGSAKSKRKITERAQAATGKPRRKTGSKKKKIKSVPPDAGRAEGEDAKGPEIQVTAAPSTPTKKKVLFDLETSTSSKSQPAGDKNDIELLVARPRAAFKSLDTDSSVASSVLDCSKKQAAAKSANDEISDWEMSDILT